MSGRCGGAGPEKEPNDELIEYVEQIREPLEAHIKEHHGEFKIEVLEPVKYRAQLVNGVNFFVKAHVGGDRYIHFRFHRTFIGELSVHSVLIGDEITKDSSVEYF